MHIPTSSSSLPTEGTAPAPPATPGVPVERHPYNDEWASTFVAILLMSVLVFAVLGVLVRNSFRLVPTGVVALRTLVGGRPDGYHQLADDEPEHTSMSPGGPQTNDAGVSPVTGGAESGEEVLSDSNEGRRQLELLSDDDDTEDARIIHVGGTPQR